MPKSRKLATVYPGTSILAGTRLAINKLEPLRAGQGTCPPLSLPGLAPVRWHSSAGTADRQVGWTWAPPL